jgi:uncharacterized protein (DUF4415 family)
MLSPSLPTPGPSLLWTPATTTAKFGFGQSARRAADDPDAQPSTDAKLQDARRLYPVGTEPILLPVDRAILDWFRTHRGEANVQEAINQALKEYVAARQWLGPRGVLVFRDERAWRAGAVAVIASDLQHRIICKWVERFEQARTAVDAQLDLYPRAR